MACFDFFIATEGAVNFDFAGSQKIGLGAFGPVYKPQLTIGKVLAVKRLSKFSRQGLNEFKNEPVCYTGKRDLTLFRHCSRASFIFTEIQGLENFHRDLKTTNILLDTDLNPSDFGMAKTFQGDKMEEKTRRSFLCPVLSQGPATMLSVLSISETDNPLPAPKRPVKRGYRLPMVIGFVIVTVLFPFVFSFLSAKAAAAGDILSPNQSITDGQTLVSNSSAFELGFFSPGNSSNRYLGIWYKNLSFKTVWVANRENPLSDMSGIFTLTADGNLAILNGSKDIIWSSNISKGGNSTFAQLLDSGNLVLWALNSTNSQDYLWQSFDCVSDTFIPGMKQGINLKTGEEWYYQSWKSVDDPFPGDFTYKLENPEFPQLFIRKQDVKYLRIGPWNGIRFTGVSQTNLVFTATLVSNEDEVCLIGRVASDSVIPRSTLNGLGQLQEFYGNPQSGQWEDLLTLQTNTCDNYSFCGSNAFCDANSSHICQCLKGFVPKAPQKWQNQNWSDGCVRETALDCGTEYGFLKLAQVNLPDLLQIWINQSMGPDECRVKCQSACSCTAYSSYDIIGDGNGCVLWPGDLVDLKKNTVDGLFLYVKLPLSLLDDDTNSNKRKKVATVASSIAAAILIVVCVSWFVARWKVTRNNEKDCSPSLKCRVIYVPWLVCFGSLPFELGLPRGRPGPKGLPSLLALLRGSPNFGPAREIPLSRLKLNEFIEHLASHNVLFDANDYEIGSRQEDLELTQFDLITIRAVTFDFAGSQKIGEGGYGPVFKAQLPSGQEIAVKRLSKYSRQGLTEFKNEVILISKLQHRNLVRLLGCCIQNEERILIYEYLPKGSLDSYIFDTKRASLLNWEKRFDIILGIARGLLYIHRDSRLTIIHRDLKASNILLDIDLNPKISDFGMAKTFQGEAMEDKTRRVVGTFGYMSPEYAIDGLFSVKSDVFSFGVLLLEIISGRRNRGFCHPDHDLSLLGHAWSVFTKGLALELVDAKTGDIISNIQVLRCIHVGLLCVQCHPRDRPTMSSVLSMLESDIPLPEPKRPGFFTERSMSDFSSTGEVPMTPNEINSFELGFFSLGKPMYRFLGISYKNISVPTVVWVANGDLPLLDKSGVLKIGYDGNLILLNSTRGTIWSSGLSTMVNGTVAQLLDSGNLTRETTYGKAMDSPSNTGISRTKLGLDVRTGEEWYLRSWKDWDDPSPGDFTFKLDSPELPQLVVCNQDVKKLRFGPWNGVTFIGGGIPTKTMNPILPITMVSSGDELYFFIRTTSDNIIARAFLNETAEFYWDEQSNQWVEILMLDKYICGNYGLCGFNAVCTGDDSSICQCLKGFTPKVPENGSLWTGQKVVLDAEDKFISLEQVNFPDLSHYQIGSTMPFDECQSNCQNSCSCTAFAILDIVGQESRCLHWFGGSNQAKKG
ncbi:LOW QUALITY PROTEIN: S-locus glycoprotein domain [Dillenia turbinata]|uniref:non-specific serine/threonine protein kinase n=1 Tax=Dillenia turbinata TaxID=194707 RepID=A0AAN8WIN3_9MAGN